MRRSGVTYEDEPEFANDFLSQRLTVTPAYQLPLLKLPWLNLSLNLQAKNTMYAKSLDPVSSKIVDEPLVMKYQTVKLSLQGPVFFRVYDWKQSKLKHVIEPEFEFRYATKVTNRDRLVQVDYFDYPSYSYAGFSLTSRLLSKGSGSKDSAGELLTYRISQEYYFDAAEASFFRKIDGKYASFSELNNTLRVRPSSHFAFDASHASSVNLCVGRRFMVSARAKPLRSIDRLRESVRQGETFRSTAGPGASKRPRKSWTPPRFAGRARAPASEPGACVSATHPHPPFCRT